MKRAGWIAVVGLVGCGGVDLGVPAAGDASTNIEPVATPDASIADAGVEDDGAIADAAPDADAAPPPVPCHLVPSGDAFTTVAMDAGQRFTNDAVITLGSHFVQVGSVGGIRTGGWDDPPI